MTALRLRRDGVVHLCGSMVLPLPASAVWGQMRCFEYFVGLDPFHGPIRYDRGATAGTQGAAIILGHKFGPLRLNRIGRILRWREAEGYSFSDLSRRGVRAGFPHIFTYAVLPRGRCTCRLTITVRGRWTAGWLPGWTVRWWLRWVLGHTLYVVRNHLLFIALRRRDAMPTSQVGGSMGTSLDTARKRAGYFRNVKR